MVTPNQIIRRSDISDEEARAIINIAEGQFYKLRSRRTNHRYDPGEKPRTLISGKGIPSCGVKHFVAEALQRATRGEGLRQLYRTSKPF